MGVMRGWWLKLAWKFCRCILSRGSKAKKKKLKSKGDQPGVSSDSETSQETKKPCEAPTPHALITEIDVPTLPHTSCNLSSV